MTRLDRSRLRHARPTNVRVTAALPKPAGVDPHFLGTRGRRAA